MPGPAGSFSQDQWDALVRRHGGVAGVTIADQYRDIVPGFSTSGKQINPDPSYTYVFNDGTEITMRRQRDTTNVQPDGLGVPVNAFEVVDPGSALKPPSDEGKPPDIHTNPDGSQSIWDKSVGAYVPYAPAKAAPPFVPGKPDMVGTPKPTDMSYVQTRQLPNGQWVTESVTNPGFDPEAYRQAQADRQRALDAQARSQQLAEQSAALAQQKFAYDQQQDAIRNQLAQGQLSLNQAIAAATEAHNRYTAQVQKTQNDLTQRGQDVTMRNEEINSASQIGNEASRAATASLPYLAPAGSTENISKAISSIGSGGYAPVQYGPIPTAPFPFDPTNVGLNVTKQILAGYMGDTANSGGFTAPPRPTAVNTNVQMPEPVFTAPG